jgi:N-acetyl-alpha-D-glucosaminyl L-malate synthase BshA
LLHISNFRKVKRVEDVLRVFDKVRKQIPAKLILIGDGPERGNIDKLCKELDTCGDIYSLGKIKDVEKIIGLADLFLLTSETESFGLAALESMAARVPVISTNTGGTPEVNVHGYSGMLSNVGDVDDMAKNALSILKGDDVLERFRSNAYEQAKKFSVEKILPMYEKLYEDVIASL